MTSKSKIPLRQTLFYRLIFTVSLVLGGFFLIGHLVNMSITQNRLEVFKQKQIIQQEVRNAELIAKEKQEFIQGMSPAMKMVANFAKVPLLRRISGITTRIDKNQEEVLSDYRQCFRYSTELHTYQCLQRQANLSMADTIDSYSRSSITTSIKTFLVDSDIMAIYVMDWEDLLYLGFLKKQNGSVQKLEEIPNLVGQLAELEYEVMDEGEYLGKVVFIYSLARIHELEREAFRQLDLQTETVEEANDQLLQQITINRLIEGTLFFFILAIALFFLAFRAVIRPIQTLQFSAKQLAEGMLDAPIDTTRQDELGHLASSFAGMRDAIRQQIDDLKDLNLRLSSLLTTSRDFARAHLKFNAMITAVKIVLDIIPTRSQITLKFAYRQTSVTNSTQYVCYQKRLEIRGDGSFEIELNPETDVTRTTDISPFHHGSQAIQFVQKEQTLNLMACYNNAVQGVICIQGIDQHQLSNKDLEFLETLVQSLSLALQNIGFSEGLEQKVRERTQELEQQNRKLEDLNSNKDQLLKRFSKLHDTHLKSLRQHLEKLPHLPPEQTHDLIQQAIREGYAIEEVIRPIRSLYVSEQAIRSKKVLLAETTRKQQIINKMALGGTGVDLHIASTLEEGQQLLNHHRYDILCVDKELIELSSLAHDKSPDTQTVFMTSEVASEYLSTLLKYPFLSNIVSRNEDDRTFTLKNILTTVRKLISQDLFGLEKYLSWGVEVFEHPVISSVNRNELVDRMQDYLTDLGMRKMVLNKTGLIAEELLMNAVYDAPVDARGKPRYNHLPRTTPVHLESSEQGLLRYACDGLLVAVSVEDPFGGFGRETILDYLRSCYGHQAGSMQTSKGKGGAGRGLFLIMEAADLLVINVKHNVKTEVIALLNIDPNKPRTDRTTSFHYFHL